MKEMAAKPLLWLSACILCLVYASAAPARDNADCVTSSVLSVPGINVYPASHQIYSTQIQYANDRTTVQVADNFYVTYHNSFKVVTAKYNETLSESYLLYQCGSEPPSLESLGLPADTKKFAVPLTAVSAPDTTVLTFMKMLGVEDRVAYVTKYTVDPCMQRLASDQCKRSSDDSDPEAINGYFQFDLNMTDPQAILFRATADPGPLNRAEYIKFVATFFNKEAAANIQFSKVQTAYNSIANQVKTYLQTATAPGPLVAWLYYSAAFKWDKWDLPEYISIKFAQYRRDFTTDAGGRLLDLAALAKQYADGKNIVAGTDELLFYNLAESIATLRTVLADVDVVIDESYYVPPSNMTLEVFRKRYHMDDPADLTGFKFLQQGGQVLRLDAQATARGSTGWYEQAVARPDLFLRDLSQAFLAAPQLTYTDTTAPRMVRSLSAAALTATPSTFVTATVDMIDSSSCALQSCTNSPKPICPAVFLDCNGKLVTATAQQPCAPTRAECNSIASSNGNNNGSGGGAAGRAFVAPGLLMALLGLALIAVARPWHQQ